MSEVFKKQNIKKFKLNVGESIFFIFLVILAAYIFWRSSLFEVKEILVQGNHSFTAAEIVALSRLNEGTNIFKVNLSQAGERIMALPLVKEVHLTRKFPSQIIIEIKERCPVALVPVKGGFAEVDPEGVYLRPGKISASGLPVITLTKETIPDGRSISGTGFQPVVDSKPAQAIKPGQVFDFPGLKIALKVITALPHDLTTSLSEVYVDKQGQIFLYHLSGVECRLGRATNIARKGIILNQLFSQLINTHQLEYIDISITGSPVVKYKDGK
ncbi:MAG TPA: cell division protein FtsQ [Desulfotomaculum sp.]|nr:cell division protein FtsQ [Desulfotomaculum sp.]